MPLTPFPIAGFGLGLNLRDRSDTILPGEAIDLQNVEFTERGSVKQRDGYAAFGSAMSNTPDSIAPFYTSSGTAQLVIGNGNKLNAIDNAGAAVANTTSPTASPHFFARFGGPGAEVLYCANGTDSVRQWNGTAFSTPAYTGTAPTGMFVAVTPWDNRLANARGTGSTAGTSQSAVRFSDAGVPTTWTANNYVDLTPGDGEPIMGMVAWRELLFVFKQSKFFVFYGTSTDGAGNPIFNYRTVSAKAGLVSSRAVAAGRDGVYFMDKAGVYRTTGDVPELVSDKIGPYFIGGVESWFSGAATATGYYTNAAMCWHNERIYLAATNSGATTNNRVWVLDPRYGWWSQWGGGNVGAISFRAACITSFAATGAAQLVFGDTTNKKIYIQSSAYTNDDGNAILSRWRSGWLDLGAPFEKTVRETKLWGSGAVGVSLTKDFVAAATGPTNINFGSGAGPTVGVLNPRLYRKALRGTVFSLALTNSTLDQAWQLHRASLHIRESLVPSVLGA